VVSTGTERGERSGVTTGTERGERSGVTTGTTRPPRTDEADSDCPCEITEVIQNKTVTIPVKSQKIVCKPTTVKEGVVDCETIQAALRNLPGSGGTASIFIATRWQGSNIVNTTVNHNRLLGTPSYAMYSEQTSVAKITGTKWTNNEVQKGAYGYWVVQDNTVVKQGNVDAFTGANIDGK
jgi:hypothetical protein